MFSAGVFSGFCSLFITVPIERVKCLLQIQTNNNKPDKLYTGMIDCVKKIYKQNGIKGVYKGFLITLYRELPASGAYFSTYDYVKRLLRKNEKYIGFD